MPGMTAEIIIRAKDATEEGFRSALANTARFESQSYAAQMRRQLGQVKATASSSPEAIERARQGFLGARDSAAIQSHISGVIAGMEEQAAAANKVGQAAGPEGVTGKIFPRSSISHINQMLFLFGLADGQIGKLAMGAGMAVNAVQSLTEAFRAGGAGGLAFSGILTVAPMLIMGLVSYARSATAEVKELHKELEAIMSRVRQGQESYAAAKAKLVRPAESPEVEMARARVAELEKLGDELSKKRVEKPSKGILYRLGLSTGTYDKYLAYRTQADSFRQMSGDARRDLDAALEEEPRMRRVKALDDETDARLANAEAIQKQLDAEEELTRKKMAADAVDYQRMRVLMVQAEEQERNEEFNRKFEDDLRRNAAGGAAAPGESHFSAPTLTSRFMIAPPGVGQDAIRKTAANTERTAKAVETMSEAVQETNQLLKDNSLEVVEIA